MSHNTIIMKEGHVRNLFSKLNYNEVTGFIIYILILAADKDKMRRPLSCGANSKWT